MSTSTLPTPKFTRSIVQSKRPDGYWIETFKIDPDDKVPGLIGYGLASGEISIFSNPASEGEQTGTEGEWKKYVVKNIKDPVAVVPADVAGNGRQDIIICHDYGKTFLECNPQGGNIGWLENPGRKGLDSVGEDGWTYHYIGRWPAMHRLKAGYFTQKSLLEIIAMPVVHGPQDINTPIPVMLFQKPEKASQATEWTPKIVDDENFSLIHDAAQKRYDSKGQNGRDSLFVASREGINWLYYENGQWKRDNIGTGMPKLPGHDFYGSACVDVGKCGKDPYAYIITIDPFHGNTVTAYTKVNTGPGSQEWKRHVLDVYGTPDQITNEGTGPGHYVAAGDFDADGTDECLVALFGPSPYQGVYYYKPIDLENGVFAKWKVADDSAGRIAVADFKGDGKLDFATISYNVPNYFESPDPQIHIYYNDFVSSSALAAEPEVLSTYWAGDWSAEPLLYLPKPTDRKTLQNVPILEVAGYRVSLEILPPNSKATAAPDEGIKVLYGEITDKTGPRRALSVAQYQKASQIVEGGIIETKSDGAIYLRFTSLIPESERNWKTAQEVPVKTLLELTYKQLSVDPFKFVLVSDLPWGEKFKGRDFYNLTGVYFRFFDQTQLAHVQFWTAGKDVNAGVHNHNDNIFLEVHLCLSPGTKSGGMDRLKEGETVNEDDPDSTPASSFHHLVLDTLEQHGGFWDRDAFGNPVRRKNSTISYPWHKWQAGHDAPSIDIWTAFEFNPELYPELA